MIVLLFPSSPSVLCIAPVGHVELEDLNAACCADSDVSNPGKNQPDNGLCEAGNCRDCRDLFMTPNGRGAVLDPYAEIALSPPADAVPGNQILCVASFLARQSGTHNNGAALAPLSPSLPLRC